ncbi:uncharacterized protein LOC119093614 [Pollicipes pollicipes]|uniref:uncharacterized protein LOC119093614 n=1 Tax=Pollicipes pollicipes TaxID=41117 RepID=UPI001885379C|nr:uncharacterized protein LOC119093614 [Pollicipes pollicipes]
MAARLLVRGTLLCVVAALTSGQFFHGRHKRQYGPPRAYSITEVTTRPSQGGGADPAPTPTGVASYQGYPIPAAPPIEAVDQQLVAGPQPTYFQAETPQPQPTYSQPAHKFCT